MESVVIKCPLERDNGKKSERRAGMCGMSRISQINLDFHGKIPGFSPNLRSISEMARNIGWMKFASLGDFGVFAWLHAFRIFRAALKVAREGEID